MCRRRLLPSSQYDFELVELTNPKIPKSKKKSEL